MAVETIGSLGSRNHSSPALWASYLASTDFGSGTGVLTEMQYGECYADSDFIQGVEQDIVGFTPAADKYAHLRPAAGNWHYGIPGAGIVFDWGGANAHVITNNTNYTIIEGIEVTNWLGDSDHYSWSNSVGIRTGAKVNQRVYGCIVHDNNTDTANRMAVGIGMSSSNPGTWSDIKNNIVFNINGGTARSMGIGLNTASSGTVSIVAYNSIINVQGTGADEQHGSGIKGSSGSLPIMYGNLVIDCAQCYGGTSYNAASDYNTADDGTFPGTNGQTTSQTESQLFEDPGSDNYLSKTGSDVEDFAPYDASYTPATDIKGDPRPGSGNTWGGCSNVSPVSFGSPLNKTFDKTLDGAMR